MSKSSPDPELAVARAVLERDTALGALSVQTRAAFLAGGQLRRFARGEVLSRRGVPVGALTLLIDGSIEVSRTGPQGRRHVQRYLEAGQVMNLVPLLDERQAIHDAVAHTDCLVLLVDRALFQVRLDQDPVLARGVIAVLCRRTRATFEQLGSDMLLPLRQRCARVLVSMLGPYGRPREDGIAITLKISRDEFSDMLGRTRQVVGKEIRQLEEEGVIRTTYSQFTVVDEAALRRIAQGG